MNTFSTQCELEDLAQSVSRTAYVAYENAKHKRKLDDNNYVWIENVSNKFSIRRYVIKVDKSGDFKMKLSTARVFKLEADALQYLNKMKGK